MKAARRRTFRFLFAAYVAALLCLICPRQVLPAGEQSESNQDKIIAYSFRILAKGFVAAVDLDKLKEGASARIEKMDDAYFRARYLDIYEHLNDQPVFLQTYGLRPDLTKPEAIAKFRSFDKPQLYATIDAVPDIVITNEFKRYLFKKSEQMPKGNSPDNFFQSMNKMIDDFKHKYLAK